MCVEIGLLLPKIERTYVKSYKYGEFFPLCIDNNLSITVYQPLITPQLRSLKNTAKS